MAFQSNNIHILSFSRKDEFIIVPTQILAAVISRSQTETKLHLTIDNFFSDSLIDYLLQVLRSNQHLPFFTYPCTASASVGRETLFQIASEQILSLQIDSHPCFSSGHSLNVPQNIPSRSRHLLLAEYTEDALNILRAKSIYFYLPS